MALTDAASRGSIEEVVSLLDNGTEINETGIRVRSFPAEKMKVAPLPTVYTPEERMR